MSITEDPKTDVQTERANRVLEEILQKYVYGFSSRSGALPMVKFAVNNSLHFSTQLTLFLVNGLRHPCPPTI